MGRLASCLLLLAGGHAVRQSPHAGYDVIHAEVGASLEICPPSVEHGVINAMRWQLPTHLRGGHRSIIDEKHCLSVSHWEPKDTGTYTFDVWKGRSWITMQQYMVVPMRHNFVWLFPDETEVRLLPKKQLPEINSVTWYRSGQKVAWCRVIGNENVCDYVDALKDRAVLNASSGELVLKRCEPSDYGGSFTLTVNDQTKKWQEQFTIRVVPVLRVEIEVGETLHIDPEFTPHFDGVHISDIASIKWTHGQNLLDTTNTTTIDQHTGELTITNWQSPSETSVFTVEIDHDRGEQLVKIFEVATIVRVQVTVGTVMRLDPEFNGTIINAKWKYGPNLAIEYDGVGVVTHDAFDRACSITTTDGKFIADDWRAGDVLTVEINNAFVKIFVVEAVVPVEIGTTLYLDPKFTEKITSIVWTTDEDSTAAESNNGVNVAYYGMHKHKTKMTPTNGQLMVSNWQPFDGGFFTLDINDGQFAATFGVKNIVRVKMNDDLTIDLGFMDKIEQMTWMFEGKLLLEFDVQNGTTFDNVGCATGGVWDKTAKKLTAKRWTCDGTLKLVINKKLETNISVTTNVVYVAVGGQLSNDPKKPAIEDHIVWKNGQAVVADSKSNDVNFELTDGKLKLTNPAVVDDGSITVEINGQTMPQNFVVVGVHKLDTYNLQITFGDDVCSGFAASGKCMIVCSGNLNGAEPVMYFWKEHGKNVWVPGTKQMDAAYFWGNLQYDECKVKNPVSERKVTVYKS